MKPKRHDHRHDHRPDNSYQLRVYRTIKGNLQAPIAFFPLLNANLDLNFFQVVSLFVIRIKYQWRKGSSNTCQELQCNIDFMVFRKNLSSIAILFTQLRNCQNFYILPIAFNFGTYVFKMH